LYKLEEKDLPVLVVQKDEIERGIELAAKNLEVELHERQKNSCFRDCVTVIATLWTNDEKIDENLESW